MNALKRALAISVWVALAGLGLSFVAKDLLKLNGEAALIIGLSCLVYLLVIGVGAILVSGYQGGQEREAVRAEALVVALQEAVNPETGEPSLFTPDQWAILVGGRPVADRSQFEAMLRSDPARLEGMRHDLARIQSARDASLSPLAKRWLWRIVIGAVVAGIGIALRGQG